MTPLSSESNSKVTLETHNRITLLPCPYPTNYDIARHANRHWNLCRGICGHSEALLFLQMKRSFKKLADSRECVVI